MRKKVGNESVLERGKSEQTHRYLTVEHDMKLVFSGNTGRYLNKNSSQSIESSELQQIEENSESIKEANLIDEEIK